MVFNEVILNLRYGPHNAASCRSVHNLGAFDILKENVERLESTSSYFVSVRPATIQSQLKYDCVKILRNVLEKRNKGTHEKIHNSDLLKNMLNQMISFCDLLWTHHVDTERSNDFMWQCELELANMNDENHHLY